MISPKQQNLLRRRSLPSVRQVRTPGLSDSASPANFSQRRTFGSRWCLLCPKGFIKNEDFEFTTDATEALQWACQDVACDVMRNIHNPPEFIVPTEVHYDQEKRAWIPVTAGG